MEKNRTITGQLKVMETTNPKIYRVQIMALNSEVNRNGWKYINLERHLNEFRDIPILTAYVMGGMVIGDGHNYNMKRDPATGEEYASFTASDAERIVGWVPKDANIRIENIDGVDWVVLDASIWRWYAKELVDQIAVQGGSSVSIETLVTKEHQEENVDVEEEYLVLGITILGNGVAPAVAGANIRTLAELSELRSNMAENILKAASFLGEEPKPSGDANPEQEPKDNTEKGVSDLIYLTRNEIGKLAKKFNGYKILSAARDDESKTRICLMAENGEISTYTMESENETIVPEKMLSATVCGSVSFAEGCDLSVDIQDMCDNLTASMTQSASELEQCQQDLAAANERIKAMETAEKARRVQAAKDKAKAVLNGLNAKRDAKAKFDEAILNPIIADIEAGKYTEKVNADGLWIGDAEVERDVKCAAMNEQEKMDAKRAEASETTFIYDRFNEAHGNEPDGIEGLLNSLDKLI